MSEPAPAVADQATSHRVQIVENVPLARDTYRLRFRCPQFARKITPGQFLMVRLADCDDPLIGRPLALYDTALDSDGRAESVDVVYLVGGKFTRRLQRTQPGQELLVWGPLGNGFPGQETPHLIMVAGGIGQTPFLALAREHLGQRRYGDPERHVTPISRVTFCYGVRSGDFLAGVEQFEQAGVEVRVSTDDGSAGRPGLVTDLLADLLSETASESRRIVCCGPEPMMQAVNRLAAAHEVPIQVSLETPMACGIGICFSCVALIRDAQGVIDYRRTCLEGPVFDASRIAWD